MVVKPVLASLSTSSILVANGIVFFSFCSPSRGPTSTMRTWSARLEAAEANVLGRHVWRATRRAERGPKKFEDMAKDQQKTTDDTWLIGAGSGEWAQDDVHGFETVCGGEVDVRGRINSSRWSEVLRMARSPHPSSELVALHTNTSTNPTSELL